MMPQSHQQQRFAGIDGLRAVAIVSVLLFHLNHSLLPGGFVGVDVFFLISGYVVCGTLLKDRDERFSILIGKFYLRRILRIYPALVVVLEITGLLSALFIPDAFLSQPNTQTGRWAFFGASNIELAAFSNSYFSPTTDFNPYAHTWSLGVEEQFYLLFPLLLFAVLRAQRRFSGSKLAWGVQLILPALAFLSWLYSARETSAHHDSAYFNLPSRFWELAAGALLCLAHDKKRGLPTSAGQSAGLVFVGLIVLLAANFLTDPRLFPFPLVALPALGTVLCISGLVVPSPAGGGARFLMHPAVVWVGRISYSLYLWHWVVITLLRWTVGEEGTFNQLIVLILTFSLGALSYYCIELPFQRSNAFFQQRRIIAFVIGLGVIFVCYRAFHIVTSDRVQNHLGLSVVTRHREDWVPEVSEGPTNSAVSQHWSDRRIFAIGDSHAWAYGGMLRALQQSDGVIVYVQFDTGGHLGSLVFPEGTDAAQDTAAVFAKLQSHSRPGDVVLLSHLRMKRLCEQWGDLGSAESDMIDALSTEANRRLAIQQGLAFIQRLQALGLKVIIAAPLPIFYAPPFRASDWFNRMNPVGRPGFSISREFIMTRRAPAMRSIHEVQRKLPDVTVWDPLAVLCSGDNCYAFDGDKPLFFDGDHLSAYGGRMLYPSFKSTLETIWRDDVPVSTSASPQSRIRPAGL